MKRWLFELNLIVWKMYDAMGKMVDWIFNYWQLICENLVNETLKWVIIGVFDLKQSLVIPIEIGNFTKF